MSFADRLQLAYLALTGGSKAVQIVPTWELGRPKPLPIDYATLVRDGYQRNEIVYACIRYIANSAASAPIVCYGKDDEELDPLHPLMNLLAHPNAVMSGSDLIEALLVMLNIAGDAFFEKERANGGKVVGLWPMRPDRVAPIVGKYAPESYTYTVGNMQTIFKANDVLHFRYYNPTDDVFGQSPLAVCARSTDADNERTDFTRTFFTNAAVPYGLLKTKVKLAQGEAARLQEQWQDQHAGTSKWHKVAVLDSDAEYQRLGLTQTEMDFPGLTALSESRICMAFRVPPILIGALVGLDRSTFSNWAESRRTFWQDTMTPTLTKLADALTEGLAREFDGATVQFDFNQVQALQEDATQQWARAQQAVTGGWLSVNEARDIVGLEPVTGGDVFLRGMATVTEPAVTEDDAEAAGMVTPETEAEEPEPATDEVTEDQDEEAAKATQPQATKKWEPFFDPKLQRAAARRFDLTARAWEGRLFIAIRDLFRAQGRAVQDAIPAPKGRQKADWTTQLFSVLKDVLDKDKVAWVTKTFPFMVNIAHDQAEGMRDLFGAMFDVESPKVREFLRSYTFKFTDKLTDVSRDQMAALFDKARVEGWSIPDIQRELGDLYAGWSESRAEMIARSESIRASNAGIKEMYRMAGVTKLVWRSSGDDGRTCDFCLELDGRVVGIDENFFNLGDEMTVTGADGKPQTMHFDYEAVAHPPSHPDCRCFLVAGD